MKCFFMVVRVLQWLQFKVSGSVRFFSLHYQDSGSVWCFTDYIFWTQGRPGVSLARFSGLRATPVLRFLHFDLVLHWLHFKDSGSLRWFTANAFRNQDRSGVHWLQFKDSRSLLFQTSLLPPPPGIGHPPETSLHPQQIN